MFSFSFPLDYSAGTFTIGTAYNDILDFEVISMQIIKLVISKSVHESSSRVPHRFHLTCCASLPTSMLHIIST